MATTTHPLCKTVKTADLTVTKRCRTVEIQAGASEKAIKPLKETVTIPQPNGPK